MKLRRKIDNDIVEVPDEQVQGLLAAGIYEEVDENDEPVKQPEKPARRYKRRDMEAEG